MRIWRGIPTLPGMAALPTGDGGNLSRRGLAELLEREGREIQRRWLDRVGQVVAGREIARCELLDAMADYLTALATALRRDDALEPRGAEAWGKVAREHAVTRVRLGFDVDELIREFIILRQVVCELAEERGRPCGTGELYWIAELIDEAIAISVRAYSRSRDYEARRDEARHVAFVTHELRGPLNTAKLAASSLQRKLTKQETVEDFGAFFEKLDHNLDRMASLINQVILTEQNSSGTPTVHAVETTLQPLLDDALGDAREAAAAKGLRFVSPSTAVSPLVYVDPRMTMAAIRNLADNAVKYTDEGMVVISTEERPNEVVVHMRDTCPGISAEELRVIFEPFRRGRHDKKGGKEGSGLGLAIVRQFAEAQGGAVSAESPGDYGCHFWLTLPRPSRRAT